MSISGFPPILYSAIKKTGAGAAVDTDGDFLRKVQTELFAIAEKVSSEIGISDHLHILVAVGLCSNIAMAYIQWFCSNIPLIGPLLAGGDFRRTATCYKAALQNVVARSVPRPVVRKMATPDIGQPDLEILRNAHLIWCTGFDGQQFTLLVDGTHEVKISDWDALRNCQLEEFSISGFQGAELKLPGVFAQKIVVSQCPNLQKIDASGCVAKEVSVSFCGKLNTFTGGSLLTLFQAMGCSELNMLNFGECVSLNGIDLPDSRIPTQIILPAGAPNYVPDGIRTAHSAYW
ncbi:MAG: hypothetical protein LBB26_01090 [Puniceicoccales bacterium]|jgi:hypothetical protein|nr:hypothetical protein [Puniceicoccales bacterium]